MLRPVSDPFPQTPPKAIALFDLDGTLIAWDCQLLFRHFIVRREPWRVIFLPVFLIFLPLVALLGAAGMKRVFLSYLWKMPEEKLAAYSREFAVAVVPAIYPALRARVEQHRLDGHFLILASASPEFYVAEIGRELEFHLTLGTPVELGNFFPDLENHKGAAKVRRLHEVLPWSYFQNGRLVRCHGYTDSCADLPMLGLCDTASVVNPSFALEEIAREAGWEVVCPGRPWKSRYGFAVRALALLLGIGRDPGGLGKP